MGNQAVSSNAAYFQNNINVHSNEGCSAAAIQEINSNNVTFGTISCPNGTVNLGSNMVRQDVNCNNSSQIAAIAKAASMELSESTIKGIGAFLNDADASNVASFQTNIAMYLQSRCDATINQSIQNDNYKVDALIGGSDCNVLSNMADQKFICTNAIVASASSDEESSQTARATVEGVDMTTLLLYIIVAIVVVVFAPGFFLKGLFVELNPQARDQWLQVSQNNVELEAKLKSQNKQIPV